MRHHCDDLPCPRLPNGMSGSEERVTGADQIINDQRGSSVSFPRKDVTSYNTGTAVFIDKAFRNGKTAGDLQRFAESFRAFYAPGIRRYDAKLALR